MPQSFMDMLSSKAPEKHYPVGSIPKSMPQYSSGNDAEHRTYIGPDFPPQAYPQPSHMGSQSMSPNKDTP